MEDFNYRNKIYPKYTSQIMKDRANLSDAGYLNWTESVSSYLSGWLPVNRQARCLDVACGAGHMLHLLKTAGYTNVTG